MSGISETQCEGSQADAGEGAEERYEGNHSSGGAGLATWVEARTARSPTAAERSRGDIEERERKNNDASVVWSCVVGAVATVSD
jgi:hypothetical protein